MAAFGLRAAIQAFRDVRRDWPAANLQMETKIADQLRGATGKINAIWAIAAWAFAVYVVHHQLVFLLGESLWLWIVIVVFSILLVRVLLGTLAVIDLRSERQSELPPEPRRGWRKRVFQARWWFVATTPLWLPLELFKDVRSAAGKVTGLNFGGPALWAMMLLFAVPIVAKSGKRIRAWSSHRGIRIQVRDPKKEGAELVAAAVSLMDAGELNPQTMARLLGIRFEEEVPAVGTTAYILMETYLVNPDLVRLNKPISRDHADGIIQALERLNGAHHQALADASGSAAGNLRNLSREELGLASRVFGETLSSGRLLVSTAHRFTVMRSDEKILIHLDPEHFPDPMTTNPELLVHQLTHAWQFIHERQFTGSIAQFARLGSRIKPLCSGTAEYELADLGVKVWLAFSYEQQAAIVEHWYGRNRLDLDGAAAHEDPAYRYVRNNLRTGIPLGACGVPKICRWS